MINLQSSLRIDTLRIDRVLPSAVMVENPPRREEVFLSQWDPGPRPTPATLAAAMHRSLFLGSMPLAHFDDPTAGCPLWRPQSWVMARSHMGWPQGTMPASHPYNLALWETRAARPPKPSRWRMSLKSLRCVLPMVHMSSSCNRGRNHPQKGYKITPRKITSLIDCCKNMTTGNTPHTVWELSPQCVNCSGTWHWRHCTSPGMSQPATPHSGTV